MDLNMIIQIYIFITEAVAMWLTQQHREHWRKYAPIIGLAGEPAWIYSSYASEQWGIFGLSLIYTYIWAIGFKTYWIDRTN